jgi:hypothetical protein
MAVSVSRTFQSNPEELDELDSSVAEVVDGAAVADASSPEELDEVDSSVAAVVDGAGVADAW